MNAAANDNHASLFCCSHSIQQAIRENEVAEMIHNELLLEPVHLLEPPEHDAGVEDEHVEGTFIFWISSGAGDHRLEVRQLQHHGCRLALDARARLASFLDRSRSADDMRASKSQHPHGLESEPRVAARDDGGHPCESEPGSNLLRRGVLIERAARCARALGSKPPGD